MGLILTDPQGNWMLQGIPWKKLKEGAVLGRETSMALYGALCKLKDYERSGLTPKQVEVLDELYLEKCEEVNQLKVQFGIGMERR